jgi:hypothetical protein
MTYVHDFINLYYIYMHTYIFITVPDQAVDEVVDNNGLNGVSDHASSDVLEKDTSVVSGSVDGELNGEQLIHIVDEGKGEKEGEIEGVKKGGGELGGEVEREENENIANKVLEGEKSVLDDGILVLGGHKLVLKDDTLVLDHDLLVLGSHQLVLEGDKLVLDDDILVLGGHELVLDYKLVLEGDKLVLEGDKIVIYNDKIVVDGDKKRKKSRCISFFLDNERVVNSIKNLQEDYKEVKNEDGIVIDYGEIVGDECKIAPNDNRIALGYDSEARDKVNDKLLNLKQVYDLRCIFVCIKYIYVHLFISVRIYVHI